MPVLKLGKCSGLFGIVLPPEGEGVEVGIGNSGHAKGLILIVGGKWARYEMRPLPTEDCSAADPECF